MPITGSGPAGDIYGGITCDEAFRSRNRTDSYIYTQATDERLYVLQGSDDDQALQTALQSAAPNPLRGLVATSYEIEEISSLLWLGRVKYGTPNVLGVGQTRYQFNTAGGTQHVTQSKQTVGTYSATAGGAPNMNGAINVSANDVQGVDIVVPVYEFEETHVFPSSTITDEYLGLLYTLTNKVCSGPYKGGQEGEIIFLGAGGGERPDETWEITFKFAGSPNSPASGLTVGAMTGIAKKGWEYLWVYYGEGTSAEGTSQGTGSGAAGVGGAGSMTGVNVAVQTPLYAYVERLYDEADLSQLGIGTQASTNGEGGNDG